MSTETTEKTEVRQITLAALVAASGVHAEPADDSGGVRLFCGERPDVRRDAFRLSDYGVDSSCGAFLHMTPRNVAARAVDHTLRHRGADGFAVGSDAISRAAFGKIPEPAGGKFQHNYGAEAPIAVHGWAWSDTFGRWSALVTFADGWRGFTYPRTWGA